MGFRTRLWALTCGTARPRRPSWVFIRSFARRGSSRSTRGCPRRAGRPLGWPERDTPTTSPRATTPPSRGQSCTSPAAGCIEGCPRAGARSGSATVDGMPRDPLCGFPPPCSDTPIRARTYTTSGDVTRRPNSPQVTAARGFDCQRVRTPLRRRVAVGRSGVTGR